MHERAKEINAELLIQSVINQGTEIHLYMKNLLNEA